MKRTFRLSLTLIMLIFLGTVAFSQVNPNSPDYQRMKAKGLIALPKQVTPAAPVHAILPSNPGNGGNSSNGPLTYSLKVPLDGDFIQPTLLEAPPGNDDLSSVMINCPFTFCFYGTNQTHFWINNNGNVSFDGPYYEYTATGFPYSGFPMLAPFWADVVTWEGLGEVWYKMEAHRVVVIWNNVGYYTNHGDKRNTFELIFTDGTDPLIGVGNNVAFSYTTMQWTTGDASLGSNGFGGVAATVGVNKGDGVKYALVGRFDHAGTDFDGAGGANDGVGYLEGKFYTFNACGEDVIIPPSNIPTLTEWGLIFLGLALLGFGTFYILKLRG